MCCVYPSNLEIKSILYNFHHHQHYYYLVVYILQILKSRASYTTSNVISPMLLSCVYPSNLEIKSILYNCTAPRHSGYFVVYILQILKSRASYTTEDVESVMCYSCVYPSNLEIKSILYNRYLFRTACASVVYILQILKSRASYTTCCHRGYSNLQLCISFKS